ncbi:unnamed protein product [Diatraea saccharalis]|uniref:Peptidase S1 domain-containing protein n=1 Tax=Diatraea saccharalis TaxID=40085 RepID=A0A9N9R2I9_9NEOP|nr:unnamed protein product [Diatraea saccharalis]
MDLFRSFYIIINFDYCNMLIKPGIIFAVLVLGCLGLPTPDTDFSQFFDHVNPDRVDRIVGGSIAKMHDYPHLVAMVVGATFTGLVCGGSIITQRTVLTAAHCIEAVFSSGSLNSNLRLRAGSNFFNQDGVLYPVSHNKTHEDYVRSIIKNDVGLLYTTTNIIFNALVQPIPLDFEYVGGNIRARAVGWGRTVVSIYLPIPSFILDNDKDYF